VQSFILGGTSPSRDRSDAHNVIALCAAVDRAVIVAATAPQQQLDGFTTPGVIDNHPKVTVSGADLPFILVALVGGDQPAVTPEEL
jgi:hypothetical protein